MNRDVKPFIKWAGGKTGLLNEISNNMPIEMGISIKKYIEPFVGGGAVLYYILSNYNIDEVYISDANDKLITTYNVIKNNVYELLQLLELYENEYLILDSIKQREYYYRKRNEFNDNVGNSILTASLFIFLNKTCFNGLYRVNRGGKYNVPIGSYKRPNICDTDNLLKVSNILQRVNINCADYNHIDKFIDKNTFVYMDPPYRPLNKTSRFTSYTQLGFDDIKQIELSEFIKHICNRGAKVLLSNSDPKNTSKNDVFFDVLYTGFYIQRVNVNRYINSNKLQRGKVSELLISNYSNIDGEKFYEEF